MFQKSFCSIKKEFAAGAEERARLFVQRVPEQEKISLGLVMETIVLLVVGQARWLVWHAAEQEKNNEQA